MAGNRHPQDLFLPRRGRADMDGDAGASDSSALSSELHDALQMHLRRLEESFAEEVEEPPIGDLDAPANSALLAPPEDAFEEGEDDQDDRAMEEEEWPGEGQRLLPPEGYEGEEVYAEASLEDDDGYHDDEDETDGGEDGKAWVFDRVGLPPRRASDGRNAMPAAAPPLAPAEPPLPDWLVSRAEERLALEEADRYQPHERWNAAPAVETPEERPVLLRPPMMILTGLLSVGALGIGVMAFGSSGSQPAASAVTQQAADKGSEADKSPDMEPVRVATTRATTVIPAPAETPSAPAAADASPAMPADATGMAAPTGVPADQTPTIAVARVAAPPTSDKQNTDAVPMTEPRADNKAAADADETVAMVDPGDDAAEPQAPASAAAPAAPTPERTVKVSSYVNMRAKPQSRSATVTVIPAGVTVDLYRCDQWCEVGYNGKRGYVYKTFVDGNPANDKPAPAKSAAKRSATPAERIAAERNATGSDVLPGTTSTATQPSAAPSTGTQSKWGWLQNWKFK